ncbi:MAG: nucleoside-diphosphate sugar epimerase/dehydratase [Waterburya sp.]
MKNRYFLIIDTVLCLITPILALVIRLDGEVKFELFGLALIQATIIFLLVKLTILYSSGFYRHYWRYASIDELTEIVTLGAAITVVQTLLFHLLSYTTYFSLASLPRSIPLLDGILSIILIGGLRFSFRAIEQRSHKRSHKQNQKSQLQKGDRVLIVGAGDAGVILVKRMQNSPHLGMQPVGFIDDDPVKYNHRILGLTVLGNRYHIPELIDSLHISRVIIAMPSAAGEVMREIVDICLAMGVRTSTVPGVQELINGRVRLGSLREIKIEDLLRREPIKTDIQAVLQLLQGKKVLITGAGGSIGSELCRQVIKCCPQEIILVGHGENSLFNIQQELQGLLDQNQEGTPENLTRLNVFVADLRFHDRLESAFDKYRPDIIFHAAAHKHVPLMEYNPTEAITNNVIGTKNLLKLASRYRVSKFVMISTDKAINPTNVMGASKRVAEMLTLHIAKQSDLPFAIVRFGNVLGSRGSVIPTFQKQIAAGGPVTVTHPDICRYFMTIPEAVQLVLQASVLTKGGEVFMLNMGKSVKIVDLAKDLISLSGYKVGKDIAIKFTGLRPGEKLFEELLIPGEKYKPTPHDKLLVIENTNDRLPANLIATVKALEKAALKNDPNLVRFLLEQLVVGYSPNYSSTVSTMTQQKRSNAIPTATK